MFSLAGGLLTLLNLAELVLVGWALIDAATRPPAAFVVAGKQTKQIWLAISGVAAAFALLGFFALIALVAAIVYFVDVRPAVRQVRGDGNTSHMGPYGPW